MVRIADLLAVVKGVPAGLVAFRIASDHGTGFFPTIADMSPMLPLNQARLRRAAYKLEAIDPDLAAMVAANGTPPLWAMRPGFASLIEIILGQQVTLASASAAYRRLSNGLGRVTPGNVLGLSHKQLMKLGQTRQKARYCQELARAIVDGHLDLASLNRASAEDVREELLKITGIGRWTADIYLLMALGHPDIWPRGDLALYQVIRNMNGSATQSKALEQQSAGKLDEYANRWRPWRAVAARILWHHYLCSRRR